MRIPMIVLLLLFCAAAAANERFITTKGEATVEMRPDFVKIDLSIFAVGSDPEQIKADVDERTHKVLLAAADAGVAGADIESSGINVTREYETDRNDNEILRGFEVKRTVQVKLRAIEKYERFAQALIDARVDEVESVEVSLDDVSVLQQQALVAATRNARKEADAIAAELGIRLGLPLEISEDRLRVNPQLLERALNLEQIVVTAMSRNASSPAVQLAFQPHAIEAEAVVWARFEILEKKAP